MRYYKLPGGLSTFLVPTWEYSSHLWSPAHKEVINQDILFAGLRNKGLLETDGIQPNGARKVGY